eukprot:553056-Prymnesium_polylepis.2
MRRVFTVNFRARMWYEHELAAPRGGHLFMGVRYSRAPRAARPRRGRAPNTSARTAHASARFRRFAAAELSHAPRPGRRSALWRPAPRPSDRAL